jgi:hypothetical protein
VDVCRREGRPAVDADQSLGGFEGADVGERVDERGALADLDQLATRDKRIDGLLIARMLGRGRPGDVEVAAP